MPEFPLCSNCFCDQGLKLDAQQFGVADELVCPNCHTTDGRKLSMRAIIELAHRFFVWGTIVRLEYGAAPRIKFNDRQKTSIETSPWFEPDVRLIEKTTGMGFFYYGPRLWMVGEVEPLKALQEPKTRASIIDRMLAEYPTKSLVKGDLFSGGRPFR